MLLENTTYKKASMEEVDAVVKCVEIDQWQQGPQGDIIAHETEKCTTKPQRRNKIAGADGVCGKRVHGN